MDKSQILGWLKEQDPERLETLWRQADTVRRESVGDAVHLRGLIEFSNHCVRRCGYCGLNVDNRALVRYRMTGDEILECAGQAVAFGYGTVVLQSGEDYGVQAEWLADVVRRIKDTTSLAVTLSVGERPDGDLRLWREAGADRYLLRFETSNRALYEKIHPSRGQTISDRIAMLRAMRAMGYEIGSGVMVGIPGQTYDDLANDILLMDDIDLDMIGIGPYLLHPDTPLGADGARAPEGEQTTNDELTTYKMVALARLVCPGANIPSTTALATINLEQGRELGLSRGANVVMPNLTPTHYRALYEIYPAKACINETSEQCQLCMEGRIHSIGRHVGSGRGDSARFSGGAQPAGSGAEL